MQGVIASVAQGSFKERLQSGQPLIGTFISEVRNPLIAGMLAEAGMDFLIVDMEHAAYNYETAAAICAVGREAGIGCLVRIPEIRRETVLKPLDMGAAGLLVPQVESVDQVRALVQHAKYPPQGKRGAALRRAHNRYGQVADAAGYLAAANEQTVLVIQVESPQAVEALEDMLTLRAVDGVFVGPFDLSVAMGIPGQLTHPALQEQVEKVIAACQRHGVICGIHQSNIEGAKFWLERGIRLLAYSGDGAMIVDAAAAAVRALVPKKGAQ